MALNPYWQLPIGLRNIPKLLPTTFFTTWSYQRLIQQKSICLKKQNKQTIPIDNIAVQQSQWSGTLTRSCFQFPSTSRNRILRWTTLYPIYNSTIGNEFYNW